MAGRVYLRNKTYWIALSYKGTEYRHSAKTNKKREAENVLVFYLGQCARGEFHGFMDHTHTYTIAEMLTDLVVNREQARLRDIDTLKRRIQPLVKELGAITTSALTERRIDVYVKKRYELGHQPATVQCEMRYLMQAFRVAKRKKLVKEIPEIPSIVVHNARQGFFEADGFERIVAELPAYLKDVVRFGYYTGWRRREVTRLEWRYIEGQVLRLPPELSKNKDGRVLVLTGILGEILERQRLERFELCPYVFHREGRQIKDFRKAWAKACTRAGVSDRYFHDFRRTAVRNLTRAGVPEKIAMSITDHKTRAVFDRYNIVNEEDIREGLERTFEHLAATRVRPIFRGKADKRRTK
jgi:integrase